MLKRHRATDWPGDPETPESRGSSIKDPLEAPDVGSRLLRSGHRLAALRTERTVPHHVFIDASNLYWLAFNVNQQGDMSAPEFVTLLQTLNAFGNLALALTTDTAEE